MVPKLGKHIFHDSLHWFVIWMDLATLPCVFFFLIINVNISKENLRYFYCEYRLTNMQLDVF